MTTDNETKTQTQTFTNRIPRYMALARCFDHIERVQDQPQYAVALERSQERLAHLLDSAPSGSGFDSGTTLDGLTKTGALLFSTAFHHMTGAGYYDGWTYHTVRVIPSLAWGYDLRVTGKDRNGIKDYIADTFACWLNELVDY